MAKVIRKCDKCEKEFHNHSLDGYDRNVCDDCVRAGYFQVYDEPVNRSIEPESTFDFCNEKDPCKHPIGDNCDCKCHDEREKEN